MNALTGRLAYLDKREMLSGMQGIEIRYNSVQLRREKDRLSGS